MTAAYEYVLFSDLLHHPAATTGRLSSVRALRLRRRGAADLALMPVEQLERDAVVVDFTSRLLAVLARSENSAILRQAIEHSLPWTTFLPSDDLDLMLDELIATAAGAAALDNLAPIAILLEQWKHSAEVFADPELHAMVTREPEGDLGAVPVPETADR